MNLKITLALLLLVFISCSKKDKSFSSDVNNLTKIVLTAENESVFLEKINDIWLVNGEHKPDALMLSNILEILKYLKAEYPLSKTESHIYHNGKFKVEGLNIDLYAENKLEKNICLLFSEGKTFGRIGEAKQAYAVYLPGSPIKLEDYLVPNANFWMDNVLLETSPKHIAKIEIRDNNNRQNSFVIKKDNSVFKLLDADENPVKFQLDSAIFQQYITYYNSLFFKQYLQDSYRDKFVDKCIYDIYITTTKNKEHYSVFYKKNEDSVYDRNEFFLINNNTRDTLIAGWINFDILLKNINDFKK